MYVSRESPERTEHRLLEAIAAAELTLPPGAYAFVETPVSAFPAALTDTALAFVRDADVWSALVPSTDADAERFRLFAFHFPPGLDNSGFVGWLASRLKAQLGTGVFVVCGQNGQRGGIFDYWGVPLALGDAALAEVEALRDAGRRLEAPD